MYSIELSLHDTFLSICSLNGDKAMGGDEIPPVIIKGAPTAILEPVHYLFELCLKKASLPLEWRDHYVTPIHINFDDKSVITNYRPICFPLSPNSSRS